MLSKLNEIEMPDIAKRNSGTVLISAGGKFTASFRDLTSAQRAKEAIIKMLSTTLPMLEFQCSEIVAADTLRSALRKEDNRGLIEQLSESKRCFRGYGYTYNPHLQVCDECGEYPSEHGWDSNSRICRFCHESFEHSKINPLAVTSSDTLTSIERIYREFLKQFPPDSQPHIPRNFENLFTTSNNGKETQRMAVWASDINNMGDKIPLWLSVDEENINGLLSRVTDFNIKFITSALIDTFRTATVRSEEDEREYIPFRIIIGGGDDLCIVMNSKYILPFTLALSRSLHRLMENEVKVDKNHPLNIDYLESLRERLKFGKELKPHSFGGAFVVVPLHTPFRKIHQLSESLMKEAKKKTQRMGNSVNWRVLSTDEQPVLESLIPLDKPLFIEKRDDYITFEDYYEMTESFSSLSSSYIQQVVSRGVEIASEAESAEESGKMLETFLKRMPAASGDRDSLHNKLILEPRLRKDGTLSVSRLFTLFELIRLYHDNAGKKN